MNYIYIEEEINITDLQKQIIENTVNKVCEKENLPGITLCVLITDKEGIRVINRENRNIDKETDVLSFPYLTFDENYNMIENPEDETDPETNTLMLGDMVICMDVIEEHAQEYLNTAEQELAYMVVHSMYHLLGYDHMNEEDKKIMREKEKQIIDNQEWRE